MKRLLFAFVAIAACGGRPMHQGDPALYGIDLIVEGDAASYTRDPDFRPRLKRVLELAAAFCGHAPQEYAGLRIVFRGTLFQCGHNDGDAQGCNDPDANTVTVATLHAECYPNIESSVLPHELLHYFIGDPSHTAPLWRALDPLWWQIHAGVACAADQSICGQVCSYSWQWNV